jgi:LAO/AO transport system kinase
MHAVARPPLDRRALGLALTRIARARAPQLPGRAADVPPSRARRIGLTGAPGAGKSTLAGRLALQRMEGIRMGVVAIDPTSPKTGGAILGDRIRMDDLQGSENLFIRSFGSRSAVDGLTENLPDILETMERFGFDEIILETVGVGQVESAVRTQVDTLVLVVPPDAGDVIQAMKAGIVELADIVVVNKADVPLAPRMAGEIRKIIELTHPGSQGWVPPVLLTAQSDPASIQELSRQVDRHSEWLQSSGELGSRLLQRARYRLQRQLERAIEEALDRESPEFFSLPDGQQMPALLQRVLDRLHSGVEKSSDTVPREGR